MTRLSIHRDNSKRLFYHACYLSRFCWVFCALSIPISISILKSCFFFKSDSLYLLTARWRLCRFFFLHFSTSFKVWNGMLSLFFKNVVWMVTVSNVLYLQILMSPLSRTRFRRQKPISNGRHTTSLLLRSSLRAKRAILKISKLPN